MRSDSTLNTVLVLSSDLNIHEKCRSVVALDDISHNQILWTWLFIAAHNYIPKYNFPQHWKNIIACHWRPSSPFLGLTCLHYVIGVNFILVYRKYCKNNSDQPLIPFILDLNPTAIGQQLNFAAQSNSRSKIEHAKIWNILYFWRQFKPFQPK